MSQKKVSILLDKSKSINLTVMRSTSQQSFFFLLFFFLSIIIFIPINKNGSYPATVQVSVAILLVGALSDMALALSCRCDGIKLLETQIRKLGYVCHVFKKQLSNFYINKILFENSNIKK